VLFGPERTGLENEDMALADAVVTIPVASEYPSLNVGQAVVVCAYEWFMALNSAGLQTSDSSASGAHVPKRTFARRFLESDVFAPPSLQSGEDLVASRAHLEGLLGQMEAALDAKNFWRVPEKKEIMWRNIRATLVRAGLTEQEIATWRGMLKALKG
jgi:tRNA/rRNA methyltransferase